MGDPKNEQNTERAQYKLFLRRILERRQNGTGAMSGGRPKVVTKWQDVTGERKKKSEDQRWEVEGDGACVSASSSLRCLGV